MLKAMLLGYNGIVLQSDTDGNLTSVDTATEYPTDGVVVRKKYNGNYNNIFTIKTNGEFELCNGAVNYQAKAPSGVYGIISKHTFGGQANFGVVIRLDGSKSEELQIIIQDNLTGLSSFRASVQLHEVLD